MCVVVFGLIVGGTALVCILATIVITLLISHYANCSCSCSCLGRTQKAIRWADYIHNYFLQ